jgi:hypothetical protein
MTTVLVGREKQGFKGVEHHNQFVLGGGVAVVMGQDCFCLGLVVPLFSNRDRATAKRETVEKHDVSGAILPPHSPPHRLSEPTPRPTHPHATDTHNSSSRRVLASSPKSPASSAKSGTSTLSLTLLQHEQPSVDLPPNRTHFTPPNPKPWY